MVTYNPEALRTQQSIYTSANTSLQKQLSAKQMQLNQYNQQISSAITEQANNQALLDMALDKEKRLLAVVDLIARNDLDQVQADIKSYKSKVVELDYKLKELNYQKLQTKEEMANINASFKKDNLTELSDKQKQVSKIHSDLQQIAFRNRKQKIVSPVDGYVNTLFIHTVGGVVTPAEKLLSVVPINTPLVIKTTVLNKDIGFVRANMPVSIKIDTFDFQKYGLLNGKVKQVSKDSIDDEKLGPIYEVYVTPINKTLIVEGRKVSITSGMSLTAEIKVGKRRIIEFFIYPLIKYWNEGISIR